jgi:tetrahydromethanopterin S-methyltransferase subunit G
MKVSIPFMKSIAAYLACAIFIIGIAPRVDASFAPSGILHQVQTDRTADLATLQKALEQKMVKERLANLGLTSDEIQARLGQLSDQQLHNVATQLDDLKVGGDSGIGIVIGLLIIAILVVLLIQLTGHRVIVK